MPEMDVVGVGVDQAVMQPVLLLREVAGQRRLLPIWIGVPEARAIEIERRQVRPPRPMAHQLLADIVESFHRNVEQVRITSLREGQFHAELIFDSGTSVSSRPSDAIAIALYLRIPINALEAVLDQAGLAIGQTDTAGEDAAGSEDHAHELEEFRRFLDNASPEDFDL